MIKYIRNKFLNLNLKQKFLYLISGFITIVPTILIAILASAYYYLGIETLFNDRISNAISKTVTIAELYYEQNSQIISSDILQIEKSINRQIFLHKDLNSRKILDKLLDEQVKLREISDAVIFTDRLIIAKNSLCLSFFFQKKLTKEQLEEINQNKISIEINPNNDTVLAFMRLDKLDFDGENVYLMITKMIDKDIINYLQLAKGSKAQYNYLITNINHTKKKLLVAFIILSLLMCMISFIISIKLARIITKPLHKLLNATSRIQEGDYSVRLPEMTSKDEISRLAQAFNKMTQTIEKQHNDIDERVKFIEMVLTETSSGIIALNPDGIINLSNYSAQRILSINSKVSSQRIIDVFPEIEQLISKIQQQPNELFVENISIKRKGRKIHLFIKIGAVIIDKNVNTIVISFEDITKLDSAQREAAWSDVARRIAHEIKNPLTPIQLSAERLSTKFDQQIIKDKKSFQKYTEAIVRNANDIQKIISEFIQFARIPKPKLKKENIIDIVNECLFNQKNIYKNIDYKFKQPKKQYYTLVDKTQITQVITNLSKNAAESILNDSQDKVGEIKFQITILAKYIRISIIDNGPGIDPDIATKVTEPYITTKPSGMGLGLAIVKRILEDHDSKLQIANNGTGVEASFKLT